MSDVSPTAFEPFGHTPDGQEVRLATLRNAHGMTVRLMTMGAGVQSLTVPDRDGRIADVVLGHGALDPYVRTPHYMGALVGRFANRIAGGRFQLDGRAFSLATNEGETTLHGGPAGFDKAVWSVLESGPRHLALGLVSPDGDQGFPGRLEVQALYRLAEDRNELTLDIEARTDAPTVVSIAPHAYFNLAGEASGRDVMDHRLRIPASAFTPVDADLIPTGERRPVDGGPFDFRQFRRIGDSVADARDDQIRLGRGYDHNFILDDGRVDEPRAVAQVEEPASGRVMTLFSTEPGLQVYSGNFLTGELTGKGGYAYRQGHGLCLEPQTFPDAPNRPDFPSARLDPGQVYRHRLAWRFSAA